MASSVKDRLKQMLQSAFRAETTDIDMRRGLEEILRQSVPAFLGVDVVDPDEKFVIYARETEDGGLAMMKQSFSRRGEDIKLTDDAVEVEPVTEYQEVGRAASSEPAPKPASCGCGGHPAARTAETTEDTMNKTQIIDSLISSGRFTEADRAWLVSTPDQALTALAADKTPAPKPDEKPVEPAPVTPQTPAGQPVPVEPKATPTPPAQAQSTEEYIANAPEGVREVLEDGVRAAAAKRSGLVAHIKAAANNPFTDGDLNAKTTRELEQLARFAGVKVDYSGRAAAQSPSTAVEDNEVAAPTGVGPRILAARGK